MCPETAGGLEPSTFEPGCKIFTSGIYSSHPSLSHHDDGDALGSRPAVWQDAPDPAGVPELTDAQLGLLKLLGNCSTALSWLAGDALLPLADTWCRYYANTCLLRVGRLSARSSLLLVLLPRRSNHQPRVHLRLTRTGTLLPHRYCRSRTLMVNHSARVVSAPTLPMTLRSQALSLEVGEQRAVSTLGGRYNTSPPILPCRVFLWRAGAVVAGYMVKGWPATSPRADKLQPGPFPFGPGQAFNILHAWMRNHSRAIASALSYS